jgi:DNA polymerase delta subunit 1
MKISYLKSSYSTIVLLPVFQQLDIDYIIGESNKKLTPQRSGPVAILRMFGVTAEGKLSVKASTIILSYKS